MGTTMRIIVLLLSVVFYTCSNAGKITLSDDKKVKFMERCGMLAARLAGGDKRCEQGMAELLKVGDSRRTADFMPYIEALGYVVPGFVGPTFWPLFWTAFDGQDGYKDANGRDFNPYKLLLKRNAGILSVWTSYNILPAALMNDEEFTRAKIIPGGLVWPFWQQYSKWMALKSIVGIPTLWMTGGTVDGYFPKPPDGRRPSVWQEFELPNLVSKDVVVYRVAKQDVAGKRCENDLESFERLLVTNRRAHYTCCDLAPLLAPGTDISKGLPLPSEAYGLGLFRELESSIQRIITPGQGLPGNCLDLHEKFRKDKLADDVKGAVGTIVEKAKQSLLASYESYPYESYPYESYPYGRYRGRRQFTSSSPSAVCIYLRNVLEEIGGNGRLDLIQEQDKLIGMVSDKLSVRFTELLPREYSADLLQGLLLESITYNCTSMKLAISTQAESLTVLPNILELRNVMLSFTATLGSSQADVTLNSLDISALWSVGGIEGMFEISDDLDNSELVIRGGPPGGSDLDLRDLIESLAGDDILGTSYTVSDVQIQALVHMIERGTITIIISGRFGQNTLYGIFQKRRDSSNSHYSAAFAADIDSFEFSEFVNRLTGVDISGVPVLGSLSIPQIGITISTDDIRSPLLNDTFSSESLLHIGGDFISSGLTAYFNFSTDQGHVPVFISYSKGNFNFEFPIGYVLSFRSLLSLVPDLQSILNSVTLPPGIDNLLDIEINHFLVDTQSGAISINATYPDTLTFFSVLTVGNLNVAVDAVLRSPRRIDVAFSGQIGIAGQLFDVDFSRSVDTGGYVLDVKLIAPPSLNELLSLIPGISSIELPPGISDILDLTINDFSLDLDSGKLVIVVAYPRSLNILNDLLTVEDITLTISAVLKSPRSLSVTVSGQIGIGGVVFKIVFSRNAETGKYGIDAKIQQAVTLNSLLSLIPEVSSLPLPPFISDLLNLQIEKFSAKLDTLELSIAARYPGSLSFFDNVLVVKGPGVMIHAVLRSPRSVSLEIVGDITISGHDYSISIARDSNSGRYVLVADIGRIDITDIITEFGAAIVPDELNSIVEAAGFIRFAINDVHITFPFGGQPLQIQISGQPEIAGIAGPRISAIVVRQGGKTSLVQGFEIGSITISKLIQQISGHSVSSIAILNQELSAAILISPVTLSGVRLIGSQLSDFSINRGISFQAALQWPPDCSADAFCAVAQSAIGPDARFVLGGTIANARSFTFSAAVSDLELGSINLAKAGLEVSVGSQVEVGIFGSVEILKPHLILTGAVRVGTSGVVLQMTMTGCWESAFGVKWLTICSLLVSVSLKPGVPLAGFAFGGEVRIGDPSCGSQIQAEGFIGIDPVSPTQNYYYVNIPGKFTIPSILQALCIDVNLPKPVAESGFPRGFLSSFSLFGKELPHVPLSIPLGYRLNGTINILGLEASADVTIGLPDGIKMDISLPALSLDGDLLAMYASSSDRSRGPFLVANITLLPRPSIYVEASGYLSVLGISREAYLRITNDAYRFSIEGKFLNLFQADLEITASYGDIKSISFQVQGGFRSDLFNRISDLVNKALQKSADEATTKISSAQQKVNNAKGKFDAANKKLSDAQSKVDSKQKDFDSAVRKLRKAQDDVRKLCTPPRCHDVCVPAPCGTTCKARVFGKCVLRVPTFSKCCFRAPDAVCETKRGACIAARETAMLTLKGAEKLVDTSRVALDAANGVLEGAKRTVSTAKKTLDAANAALEVAKQTYKAGADAASALARFALNDLFNINEITFDVSLKVASGGSFNGRVSARILGKDVNAALSINVHDIASMAKKLADKAITGLSSFVG